MGIFLEYFTKFDHTIREAQYKRFLLFDSLCTNLIEIEKPQVLSLLRLGVKEKLSIFFLIWYQNAYKIRECCHKDTLKALDDFKNDFRNKQQKCIK